MISISKLFLIEKTNKKMKNEKTKNKKIVNFFFFTFCLICLMKKPIFNSRHIRFFFCWLLLTFVFVCCCCFGLRSKYKWVPTNFWKSCTRKSNLMCCAFCSVCAAGSTVNCRSATVPRVLRVRTKLVVLATRYFRLSRAFYFC